MDIIKTSIKRPVAIIMCMLVVIILGFVSLNQMRMELMPSFDIPIALIMTQYQGAGPEEVENLVSQTIEGAVANVSDIDVLMSISSEGLSLVMVQFNYGTNMSDAMSSIRDRVGMIESALPDNVTAPTIMKLDINAMPVVSLTIASDTLSDYELKSLVEDKLVPRVERQNGVASVSLTGGIEREIRVEIDPERLEGLGLSMAQIAGVLASENINLPGGSIDYGDKVLTISSRLKMASIDDVREAPIVTGQGSVLALQDIAKITEHEKKIDTISRYNGEPTVSVSVSKASDSNTVLTVNAVKNEIEKITRDYPDVIIRLVDDQSEIIENSVSNVIKNIFMGAVLAIIVLFVFLKNIGLTGVIAVSMPLSIVTTFVFLYFSGTSLNIVSLGGLSIGVGMLVDNSVVVLENIYRYRTAEGYGKIKGTYRAAKEVMGAVVASTLTTIVIFVPFVFANGLVKEIFSDLALSVVFALAASLIVAVTVVPMIAGNYVESVHRNHAPKRLDFINKLLNLFDTSIKRLTAAYSRFLSWAIHHKKRTVGVIIIVFILSLALIPFIGMELLPEADEGMISVTVEAPKGSKTEVVNELSLEVEQILEEIPEMEAITVSISNGSDFMSEGSNVSSINCELVDKTKRDRSTADITEYIRNRLKSVAGASITVSAANSMSMMTGGGVTVEIYGDELSVLEEISSELQDRLSGIEGARQVTSSIDEQDQQVAIVMNKEKIRMYGMTGSDVAAQIRSIVSGSLATTLKSDGKETDIRIVYPEHAYTNLSELADINIKTATGAYVPLSSIADIELDSTPVSINRTGQSRYVTVTCDVYGRDTGSVGRDIQAVLDNMTFPDGYIVNLAGANEMMTETFSSLFMVLVLAVILVYIVMAAQFESFINPFIIMFTIPLAATGALILLFLTGEPISMTALIGCLVLVGIVVNNGIILIEFINVRRERDGMEIEEAILSACPIRLRPILMTALTTILAQLPLIFSNGQNSEMLKGMGMVVAGGLLSSTVLTLVLVPILYIWFDRISSKTKKKLKLKPKKNRYEVDAECC